MADKLISHSIGFLNITLFYLRWKVACQGSVVLVLVVLTLHELHVLDKPSHHLKVFPVDTHPRNVQPADTILGHSKNVCQ